MRLHLSLLLRGVGVAQGECAVGIAGREYRGGGRESRGTDARDAADSLQFLGGLDMPNLELTRDLAAAAGGEEALAVGRERDGQHLFIDMRSQRDRGGQKGVGF